MAVSPIDSALDAVVAHFATLTVEHEGGTAPLRANRGWLEKNEQYSLDAGPLVTVTTIGDTTRDEHPPFPVEEGPLVLWKVADLVITAQLDLWAPYRYARDLAAQVVRTGLHDDIPFRPGLHLTQADYFDRPITVHSSLGRDVVSRFDASVGEWRRTWDLTITAAEVVQAATPQQLEIILRQTATGTLLAEDTSITP